MLIIGFPSHEAGKENGVEQLTELISKNMVFQIYRLTLLELLMLRRKKAKKGERYMTDIQRGENFVGDNRSEKIEGKDILF